MARSKNIIFILLMLILWLPLIQQLTGWAKEPSLHGAFTIPEKPVFSIDSLKTFSYQKKVEDYLNNTFGFRGLFVKIKNSWEYLLFTQINVEDQVEGKNGYIFSRSSIEKMIGKWYNGRGRNEQIIANINYLKEGVESRGGHFLTIFAPSKESVLPQFLPEKYANIHADSSDYEDFIALYKKYNIPCLDFKEYFNKIKDTVTHPLFTTTGFHWSSYAAAIAQDTLLSYMQHSLPDPMPKFTRTELVWSDTARDSEADFEEPMNLLFSLNQPKYVYPTFKMVPSTIKNKRPKVIIIGDSFFWQLKNLKMMQYVFSEDSKYWYYFARYSFPLADVPGVALAELNIMDELQTADYVILVGSFGTTVDFPFGITKYYREHETVDRGEFEGIRQYIKNEEELMIKLTAAAEKGKSPDQVAGEEAKRIFKNKIAFNLRASNGKFVCADAGRKDIITADKEAASSWELFSGYKLSDNKIAIASFRNKFLSAELHGKTEITANRDNVAAWEVFEIVYKDPTHVAFKAANGKFLRVDESLKQVFANAETIENAETFELIQKK